MIDYKLLLKGDETMGETLDPKQVKVWQAQIYLAKIQFLLNEKLEAGTPWDKILTDIADYNMSLRNGKINKIADE